VTSRPHETVDSLRRTNAQLATKLLRLTQELAHARHGAYHDPLTGLPNRALLSDRLGQSMAQAARQHHQVALLLIDLDGFKCVNDRFGHTGGDQLLRQVAKRLSGCVRRCDTACRYGGDEFVIMLPEIDSPAAVDAVVEKIRTRLFAPYALDKGIISITVSIGTAIYGGAGGQDCDELIEQADTAMYREKTSRDSGARAA
jgi:diguanylate cyclase (GGDEF)-like protein